METEKKVTKAELARIKREEKLKAEEERVEAMCSFEKEYSYCQYICGIDEAGRGPLAGPVVAGAVVLPKDCRILYVNDSKKLSEKKRSELFEIIKREAVSVGVGIVSPQRIDEINILQATYEAMREAINNLTVKPDILLNDAVTIPGVDIAQVPIIKGDAKSLSIASASIIAKVTRDSIMMKYDEEYPEYGFAKHKGYGTKQHTQAILEFGPCPIHRRSFIKKLL
jgi:ribonuclease HII